MAWGGGHISWWRVIGSGKRGFVPEEAMMMMMMMSGRTGEAADDNSLKGPPWRPPPPPPHPPAVIYDIFICPPSPPRKMNYGSVVVSHSGERAPSARWPLFM